MQYGVYSKWEEVTGPYNMECKWEEVTGLYNMECKREEVTGLYNMECKWDESEMTRRVFSVNEMKVKGLVECM